MRFAMSFVLILAGLGLMLAPYLLATEKAPQPAVQEISEVEARAIALGKFQGEVIEVEKEKHQGLPVFSIEIKSSDTIYEVIINRQTGSIVAEKVKHSRDSSEDDDDEDDND